MGKHAQESYVTSAIDAIDTDVIEEGSSNLYFTNQRALDATAGTIASASAAAVSSANSYSDSLASNYDPAGSSASAQAAAEAYADAAVAGLVDSAPAALDTLNELAAALGDDANFATTVTNSLAEKLDASSASSTYLTQSSASTTYATKQYVDSVNVNTQTASYELVLADAGKTIEMNVGSANNLTIPLNSSQALPIGTTVDVIQYGSGQTTIVATGGVTIRSKDGSLKLTGQYSGATLYKRDTDEWVAIGDLTT